MKRNKAKYIGPDDTEYKKGEVYFVYPIKGVNENDMIAAENAYGEAYAMPAKFFEIINN